MFKKKAISLEMAKKMGDAAEEKALELKIRIVIAIIDESGNLKLFRRMDHTSFGSVRIAMLKAETSASLPFSTKSLAEKSLKLPNDPYNGGAIPGILLLGGGLPIMTSLREHLGGIGISGATPELDEQCAEAAIDAISSYLT